jgi:hypothetical protein
MLPKPCLILFLGIMSLAGNANAERWVPYYEDESSISYTDLDSIRQVGQLTRYRVTVNFRQRLALAMSNVIFKETNCAAKRSRWVESSAYTQLFGRGQQIGRLMPHEVGMNPRIFASMDNSTLRAEFHFLCDKIRQFRN